MTYNPKYNISPLLSGALFNGENIYILASASLSIETDSSSAAVLVAYSSASLDSEVSVTASGFAIVSASANLDGILDITIAVPVTINLTGAINISISTNFIIPDILRFTPAAQNPGSYIPLVLLDGVALTDQNRKFNIGYKPIFVEKINWNSSKSRYYKRSGAGKNSFKLAWEWLPSDKENTIDKRQARNYIKNKAMDPDIHTLTIIKYGANPEDVFEENQYNVFITNYTEDLMRRDLVSGTYFWQCSLDLEEA